MSARSNARRRPGPGRRARARAGTRARPGIRRHARARTNDAYWSAKYDSDGSEPVGYKVIARRLGLGIGRVRSAERSIERKIERFAAVYAAGRLCDLRETRRHRARGRHRGLPGRRRPRARTSSTAGTAGRSTRSNCANSAPTPSAARSPRCCRSPRNPAARTAARRMGRDRRHPHAPVHPRGRGHRRAARGQWRRPRRRHDRHAQDRRRLHGQRHRRRRLRHHARRPPRSDTPAKPGQADAQAATPRQTPVGRARRLPIARRTAAHARHRRRRPSVAATRAGRHAARGKPGRHRAHRPRDRHPPRPHPANAAPGGESEFDPTYKPSSPPAPAPAPPAPGGSEFF